MPGFFGAANREEYGSPQVNTTSQGKSETNKKARIFGLAYLESLQTCNLQQLVLLLRVPAAIIIVGTSGPVAGAVSLQTQHFFPSCYS
jgi:hypothetical protein